MNCHIDSKKIFFFLFLIFFSFSLVSQNDSKIDHFASCVDFTQGGEKELIRIIEKETKKVLEDIDIVVEVNAKSVVDTLIPVVYGWAESIIDFSDVQVQSLTDAIDESTQEILDALDFLFKDINTISDTVKRYNVSKSGQFPVATITRPGYYALRDNVHLCFEIDADNVTIDLNDFTISCTGSTIITVAPGHTNVEIKNGKIKNLLNGNGIFIDHSCELVLVENVSIFNCYKAISAQGSNGQEIKDCIFRDCEIHNSQYGVDAWYLKNCVFENCSILGTVGSSTAGLILTDSDFCLVNNCEIIGVWGSRQTIYALGMFNGEGNVISNCVISNVQNNGTSLLLFTSGIYVNRAFNGKIVNCVVNNVRDVKNTASGILQALSSGNFIFEKNEVFDCDVGIRIQSGGNLLIENILYNNTIDNSPFSVAIGNIYEYDIYDNTADPVTGTIRDPYNLDNISVVMGP